MNVLQECFEDYGHFWSTHYLVWDTEMAFHFENMNLLYSVAIARQLVLCQEIFLFDDLDCADLSYIHGSCSSLAKCNHWHWEFNDQSPLVCLHSVQFSPNLFCSSSFPSSFRLATSNYGNVFKGNSVLIQSYLRKKRWMKNKHCGFHIEMKRNQSQLWFWSWIMLKMFSIFNILWLTNYSR